MQGKIRHSVLISCHTNRHVVLCFGLLILNYTNEVECKVVKVNEEMEFIFKYEFKDHRHRIMSKASGNLVFETEAQLSALKMCFRTH